MKIKEETIYTLNVLMVKMFCCSPGKNYSFPLLVVNKPRIWGKV